MYDFKKDFPLFKDRDVIYLECSNRTEAGMRH